MLNSDLAYRLQYHELPQEIRLSLRFARVGEGVTVELPEIPTEAVVAGAEEVADRAALDGAERTACTREGTTLVLCLVADAEEADPRFHANTALEEARARRFVAGVTIRTGVEDGRPVVADFEGPEPRATASGQSVRLSEPTPAWADRPDSILFWDAAADGDGRHGRATLALALGGRDWTGFDALHLGAAVQPLGGAQAPGVELLLRDAEQGLTSLGRHDGGARIDLSAVPGARRDAVDALLFRVDEADLAADPAEAGPGQRLILTDIRLAAGFEARPIRLPGVAAAGETVGIVAEAITAAQPAAGPLEIRGVRDAEGGRARLGAAGDVLLETEPGFRGVAGLTVLLADARGRTAEARVSVEVA